MPTQIDQEALQKEQEKQEEIQKLQTQYWDAVYTGDIDKQERILKKILALDPANDFAIQQLREVLAKKDERDKRKKDEIERSEKKSQLQQEAEQLYKDGELEQAREKYAELAESDAGNEEARNWLGHIDTELKSRRQIWWLKVILIPLTIVAAGVLVYLWWIRRAGVLEIIQGPGTGQKFSMERDETVVGALSADVDFVVSDANRRISRRHCTIHRSGRKYYLTDHSLNGTFVNGLDVDSSEPVPLNRGDQISLAGEVVLRLR